MTAPVDETTKNIPPIGRGLAILASFLVGYAAKKGLTLNEVEVVAIMQSTYAAVHTMYRKYREGKTGKGTL